MLLSFNKKLEATKKKKKEREKGEGRKEKSYERTWLNA